MNKQQRKELQATVNSLEKVKEEAQAILDSLVDQGDEEDKLALLPVDNDVLALLPVDNDVLAKVIDLVSRLESLHDEVDQQRSDEEDKYESMPESLQSSEKGETLESIVQYLSDASEELSEAVNRLGHKHENQEDLADELGAAVDEIDSAIAAIGEAIGA